jgi:hypothetical protein
LSLPRLSGEYRAEPGEGAEGSAVPVQAGTDPGLSQLRNASQLSH